MLRTRQQKWEFERTRVAQRTGASSPQKKRRVNITVTGELWDRLDELGVENKSSIIEDFIRELVKQKEAEAGGEPTE